MKDVKVVGSDCKRCTATAEMVQAEADKLGVPVTIEKVTDYAVTASRRRQGSLWTARCCMRRAVCRSRTTTRVGWRPEMAPMLEYRVSARRSDAHGSVATTKDAEVILDTDINGRPDAFNPAELFLAAVAACMIKGIERVTPILQFDVRGVEIFLHGVRQDSPQNGLCRL